MERAHYDEPIREASYIMKAAIDAVEIREAPAAEDPRPALIAEQAKVRDAIGRARGLRQWLERRDLELQTAIADLAAEEGGT